MIILVMTAFLIRQQAFGQGATIGNGATMEVLGVGTGALLGVTGGPGHGPLTDPELDGNEVAGPTDPSWNWVSIESNAERGFNDVPVDGFPAGTERSYNVFDHQATGGGSAKWCCGEPIASGAALATTPLEITVQLNDIYRLTHFTITSGNDTPTRDPRDWQILGSNDGITFEPIFSQISGASDTVSLWGTVRDQVNKFTLDVPAKPYKYFRFQCTATFITGTGAFFQMDEIEYFGLQGPAETTEIAVGTGNAALVKGDVTDPENDGNKSAGPTDATWNWKSITANDKPAFGNDGAFNIFDNSIGSGTDKWSTTAPSAGSPKNVTVEFQNPLVVTSFTVSSANDAPDADPLKFQLLGSNDGVTFTPFYTRDNTTNLWTARNQVVKVTLKDPSPPSKFIRLEVTQTGGANLQIGEVELFGKFGGLSNPGISGVLIGPSFFQIKVTDGLDTTFDPATVKLQIDNTNATFAITKSGTVSSVLHTQSPLYASASSHTYTFTAKDNMGNIISRSGTVAVGTYTTINAALAVSSVDTNKPGFRVKTHQMSYHKNPGVAVLPNAERQIANGYFDPGSGGTPVANTADLSAFGADGYFEETDTINYDQTATANGNFTAAATPPQDRPDRLVPGINAAGVDGTDRFAQSIETFLELKAGAYRMGFVTDDGSRLSFGRGPGDVIGTQLFSSGGTVNTTVDFVITADGFYPVRLFWFETGGGAGAEWFMVNMVTGERTLINDSTVATSVKAWRESAVSRPYVSRVLPTVGYGFAFANEDLIVDITDGAIPLASTGLRVVLNGADQTVSAGKTGAVTTVTRPGSLTNLLPPGVNTVNVIYAYDPGSGAVTVTNTYTYTVPAYTRAIPPGNKVGATEVSGTGFRMSVVQIDRSKDGNQGNGGPPTGASMPGPEMILTGSYINPTNNLPYPNLANLTGFDADGTIEVPAFLNNNLPSQLNPSTTIGATGVFQGVTDTVFPGLPGGGSTPVAPATPVQATVATGSENFVAEITTFLDMKAGVYLFGINDDDGWVCYSAPNAHDTLGTLLGFKNGPGGNVGYPMTVAAGIFNVIVPEDGIYPVRILMSQAAGGGNIEFMTIDRDSGQMTLVNDLGPSYFPNTTSFGATVPSPITAYSTFNGTPRPWVKFSVYPFPYIGTATPLITAGTGGPTLWQNRDQQSGPGPIIRKLGLLNGSWNSGEVQNNATTVRPFGDAVGAVVAGLGASDTVGMMLDGAAVTPTITAIPNSTDKMVLFTPPTVLSSTANHTAGLIYAGTTNYWVFNVITNVSVGASNALPSSAAIQSAQGFRVKIAQSTAARAGGNTAAAAELQLAGTPANILPAGPGPDGSYIVPGIVNFSQRQNFGQTGAGIGNFQTLMGTPADSPIPGLAAATGTNNFTAEIFAYLDLPAGYQKFGINGDDGFRVQIGTPGQTNNTILFTVDRGAGATDFPFAFITPQAGLYPVRIVWWQGGGDANLEFFTYGPNNEKIPVNSANGVKAYYDATGGVTNTPKLTVSQAAGVLTITWTNGGELQTASSILGPWTGTGDTDGSYTENIVAATATKFFRVSK